MKNHYVDFVLFKYIIHSYLCSATYAQLTRQASSKNTNCIAQFVNVVIKTPSLDTTRILPYSTVGINNMTK